MSACAMLEDDDCDDDYLCADAEVDSDDENYCASSQSESNSDSVSCTGKSVEKHLLIEKWQMVQIYTGWPRHRENREFGC